MFFEILVVNKKLGTRQVLDGWHCRYSTGIGAQGHSNN
jgi:hypothetical protein